MANGWGIRILALMLLLAPFVSSWEGHYVVGDIHAWNKLKMLFNGELSEPIDIFDLVMHTAPAIYVLVSMVLSRKKNSDAAKA